MYAGTFVTDNIKAVMTDLDPVQIIRHKNFETLLKKYGKPYKNNRPVVARFAEAIGKDPGQTRVYLNPHVTGGRGMGEKFAREVEKALKLEPLWIDTDHSPYQTNHTGLNHGSDINNVSETTPNIEPGPDITGRIPLISWVQAGHWAEVIDNYLPGQAEEWRWTTANVSKQAFALRVKGDSMTNPNGSPSIPEGYIITVDPNKQAENGDLVVARMDDSMEATFKKLVIDGNKRYLKALNPAYPVIEINGNCTICGKVVRVEFDP